MLSGELRVLLVLRRVTTEAERVHCANFNTVPPDPQAHP